MVDMMNTDFKPGDIVQHPRWGNGVVTSTPYGQVIYYAQRLSLGVACGSSDLTGWKRVETCTELERRWLDYRGGVHCTCDTYPGTTNGPEEDCEIHGCPYEDWVKCAAELQDELARAETVRPGHVQVRVDDLDLSHWLNKQEGDNIWGEASRVAIRAAKAVAAQPSESKPAQPDEPTEFGARVTVTLPDGTREKWLRSKVNTNEAWRAGNGSEIGWFSATTWDNVIERGTVTLGWDE